MKHYYFFGIPFEMFIIMAGFGILLVLIVYSAWRPLRSGSKWSSSSKKS